MDHYKLINFKQLEGIVVGGTHLRIVPLQTERPLKLMRSLTAHRGKASCPTLGIIDSIDPLHKVRIEWCSETKRGATGGYST